MAVISVPTPTNYPIRYGKRDAKIIETATQGTGYIKNKTLDTSNTFVDATTATKVLAINLAGMTAAKTFTEYFISDVNSSVKFNLTGSTTAKALSFAAAITDNRTVTFPDASITVASTAGAEVLENKSLEATCALVDTTDNTKTLKWNLAAQSTGVDLTITSGAETADRLINIPVLGADQTLAFVDLAQVFTAKSLESDCALVDATDNTKTLKWNLTAQSTGVDLTITSGAEVADRVINIPVLGADQTLVFADLAQTLASKTLTSPVLNTGVSGTAVLDEDNMASDSATKLATQQSIKAYVDARVVAKASEADEDFAKNGFAVCGPNALADGAGSYDVAASAINALITKNNQYELFNIAQEDIGPAWLKGTGLLLGGDQTDNDGFEFGMGALTTDDVARTVGATTNCYMRAVLSIADVSGTDGLAIGFRKSQAFQADMLNYTDYAVIGNTTEAAAMALKIRTDLNNAGETTTDTTDTMSDTNFIDARVYVGEEARLQTVIDLATSFRANWNAHVLDAAEHTAGADAGNVITAAVGTTTASVIAFITEAITKYVAHDADVILATPVYHQAQSAANDLASVVAPTTLAECVTRLNDIKAKYNLHEADATSHDAGSAHTEAGLDASSTWFQFGVGATAAAATAAVTDPTVSAAFDFDSTDVIVPFISIIQANASQTGAVNLSIFEVKDIVTA